MKVIYDCIHFAKTGWFGGISKMWLEYFQQLPGSPIDPTFIVGPASNPVQDELERKHYFGAPVIRETATGFLGKLRKISFYRNVQLLRLDVGATPTVFHSTDYINPLFKRKNMKIVTTICDMVYWDQKHLLPKGRGYWDKVWSTYHSLRVSDVIITISRASQDAIIRSFPWAAKKIVVVPLGLDASFSHCAVRAQKTHTLIFLGGRNPYKNFNQLLEAFARFQRRFPDWRLDVVGGSTPVIQQEEAARYRALGIDGLVRDHGYLGQAELVALLENAGALVIPSLNEGFNIPLLEGMAAGSPVLSSDIPASRELGQDHVRYFSPTSVDALEAALEALALTPPTLQQLHAAQQYARTFTWEASFRQLVDVYTSVVGADSVRQPLAGFDAG